MSDKQIFKRSIIICYQLLKACSLLGFFRINLNQYISGANKYFIMRHVVLSLFLTMSWLFSVGQGTITTSPPLTPNNGSTGISLRVEASSPIEITGLTNVFTTGATSATVWVRQGGVTPGGTPNVSTANGWTQVVVNAPITGANSTALDNIPFGGVKIPVPSGGSIGIFIEGTSGTSRYQTGTASDQVIFTDGTMTVNLADSVAYGGPASSPSNNPRRFVGSVTYALSVTGNCTPFTGFAIDSISGTAAKVNWTPGTGNTGYKLEYGPTGFTPGTGTVVSGTYPTSPVTPPVILSGLSASTTYDVYFEEYCNTGTDTVGFPTPQSFTTTKLCGAPTGFAESNLTSNAVDVNWSQAGSYTEAWVMWGPAGTAPGSTGWDVDTIMSPTMTYTISGLSPSTGYDIYLATNCGGGNGVSDTVGPLQIVTPIQGPQGLNCTTGQPGLIFQDDFETQVGWTGDFGTGTTASNWNYHSGPTGSTATGPTGAHSGTNYLYTEVSGTATGTHIEAITPRIDLSSSFNNAELSFWLHAYGSNIDTIKVQVGGSATGPWNTVFTRVGQVQTANADPWQQVGVNLDSYVGSAIHIRFLVIHGTSFNGDVSIDLVEVNSCQTCPFPGTPTLTYISSDSAAFSWSGAGYDYDVNWGPKGFSQGSASAVYDSTTTNSIGIGGLSGNTAYDLYIRNDCSDSANGTSGWVGPLTFVTLCNALTAPYYNGFDNDSIDQAPICWDNVIIGGTSPTLPNADVEVPSTTYPPISSPNVVRFYNYNTDTIWLISPEFSDMPVGDKRINFFAMTTTTATGNTLEVGTMSSIADRSTYTPIDTLTLTNSYQQFFVDLTTANNYNGTDTYVVLNHTGPDFRTYYIDEFNYEVIPACAPPLVTSLGVSGVGPTSANTFWGSGSDGDKTYIEWGTPGFTPGSGVFVDSVPGTTDTYLIQGLAAQTTYEFYIQDSCLTDGLSPWVGPFTFTTACNIISAPIFEDFDGTSWTASGNNAGNILDPCWSSDPDVSNGGEPFKWIPRATAPGSGNGPLNDVTGGNFMYVEASGSTAGDTAYLYTPIVDVSTLTAPALYFFQHRFYTTSNPPADMNIEVTNDYGATWTNVYSITGNTQNSSSDPWKDELVNLPQFAGDTIQIRFVQVGVGCCGDAAIDSVAIAEAPSCPDPANVQATNITDTSAVLSWNGAISANTNQVWIGPRGFYQGTTTTSGTKLFVNANSLVLDTLSPATCWEFLVRSACGPGDSSAWIGPIEFCTNACKPSEQCWFPVDLEDTFGDGWNGGIVTVVQNGVPVGDLGGSFTTGNLYPDSILLCDLQNTVFVLSTAGGWPSEIGITVYAPYGGQIGQYVANSSTSAGDTLVAVTTQCTPPTCPQPTNLVVNSVTGTTADVGWTAGGSGSAWEVEYSTGNFLPGAGTRIAAPTNPFTINSLSGSTNYNYYVREICGPGDTSVWSGPMSFTTACITVMAPYFTDFETIPIGLGTGTPATWGNCWYAETLNGATVRWESEDATGSNENSTGTGPFTDATMHPNAGGTYMYIETSTSGTGPAELTSPMIDFSNLVQPELSFAYHMYGATINKLVIQAEDINGNRIAIDSLVGQQQTAQADSFFIHTIDLSTLPQSTYAFVFQGFRGTSFTGDISIDDVRVDEPGASSCAAPLNAMATANVGCDSVEVDWTSGTGGSIIEYGPAGFTPGTGTFTNVVTAPYTIYGLTPGTAYDVWVADTCSGDTSSYAPINVTTASGPLPVAAIGSVSDTIIGNQFIVYLDAAGTSNATSYTWDFGNGVTGSGQMDTVVFLGNGTYTVVLTASNGCGSDTASYQVYVNIGLDENPLANNLNVFPNPANHKVNISFREVGSGDVQIRLRDAQGREVMFINDRMQSGVYSKDLDVSNLARGMYMVEVKSGGLTAHRRLSIR